MNYLVIATKNNGVWDASIYDRTNPLFNYLVEIAQQQTVITLDNYTVVEKGILLADNIRVIESVMRNVLGFRTCDVCGAWVTPQDRRNGVSTYENGVRKCALCVAKEEQEIVRNPRIRLSGYHETSSNVRVINGDGENFDLSNVLGVGIEMEYNHGRGHDREMKATEAFYRMANPRSRNIIFRCEQDCTVSGEIISNVFTKKALYAFDWNILTDTLKLNGNDENINKVGFHVHLSKGYLGNTPKEQALNFLKFQYFLKSYENDFMKLSGRRGGSDMEYCQFYELSEIENMKRNIVSCFDNGNPWGYMPSSHGCALISSRDTIELRIGKSTNDPVRIANYLKLILGIVENLKNVPFAKCYCIGKVTKLVPNEVMNYWRNKGCFLNTNAIENRGVTL